MRLAVAHEIAEREAQDESTENEQEGSQHRSPQVGGVQDGELLEVRQGANSCA